MKVFQIFSHPFPPCEPYFGYMQRARDMSEEYTLIAPQNFMGPRARFAPISALWSDVPKVLRENTNGARMEFDAMRVRYLSHHFDQAYLDIDIELFKPIEIEKLPQGAGPGLLVGNGDKDLGLWCWENYLHLAPNFCRPASLMFSGTPFKSLEEMSGSLFIHHYAKGDYF